MGVRANDDPATPARPPAAGSPSGPGDGAGPGGRAGSGAPSGEPAAPGAASAPPGDTGGDGTGTAAGGPTAAAAGAPAGDAGGDTTGAPSPGRTAEPGRSGVRGPGSGSRRPPTVTRDTARPEGGGRAAPGDAPAPARQWPLLTVLGVTALGLLVVGFDPFPQASRIGSMLIGVALLTGAALRRALPSVGMLAVRSRFTDMAAYGVLGTGIVLLSLMTQPAPWLEIPFLEDAVRFAVR
ncbi:DUF3017 domain-containing protein [Streptomyces lavendulocolor]|uniref:DUF3017 domain-containing protein n=1 Tax=Streptomyces lavendulocolor TaxID=67316 RepID=UPI0031D9E267